MTLAEKIQPEKLKNLPPILRGWAYRTKAGRASNQRQINYLLQYLPSADPEIYMALGGLETEAWARKAFYPYQPLPSEDEDVVDVLGLPYYGPNNGRDSHGDYFDPTTDFMDELIPLPPAAYIHGQLGDKEEVGVSVDRWYNNLGGWFRIKLDKANPRYDQLVEAKKAGTLRASSGVVPGFHDYDKDTGHIKKWLVGEISLVDMRDGYAPVNRYAVAKAEVNQEVFHDLYGDPVNARNSTLSEMFYELYNKIRESISRDVATGQLEPTEETKEELLEEAVETAMEIVTEENITMADTDETTEDTEKCEACDEAKKLKAELEDLMKPGKCARCPSIIQEIRSYVKAGKLNPADALSVIDQFTISDNGWDEYKKAIEEKSIIPTNIQKSMPENGNSGYYFAGGQSSNVMQNSVDEDYIQKQLRMASPIPVKKDK